MAALIKAYWEKAYWPKKFRQAYMVAIRKQGKDNYLLLNAWRPIALLSIVGKVIEAVIAE